MKLNMQMMITDKKLFYELTIIKIDNLNSSFVISCSYAIILLSFILDNLVHLLQIQTHRMDYCKYIDADTK